MKLLTALKYKFRVYGTMAAWYVAVYPLAMILVSFILIKTSVINENEGSLIYRLGSCVIFLFAVFIRFKEDFDFLLTLSTTRREIFLSNVITAFEFGTIFSVLVVVERVIVDYLNQIMGFQNTVDPFHFFSAYAVSNLFVQFLYFVMLCFVCSMTGILLGSLFYRFGKKFTLVFWLLFSALPTIVLPMYLWAMHQRNQLAESMSTVGSYLNTFNVLSASGTLFLLSMLIAGAAWINIRRLQQS